MRLEHDKNPAAQRRKGLERRADFGRMMSVVVDNRDAVSIPDEFESSPNALERRKPFADALEIEFKLVRDGVTEVHDLNRIKKSKAKDPLLRPGDMVEVLESWL